MTQEERTELEQASDILRHAFILATSQQGLSAAMTALTLTFIAAVRSLRQTVGDKVTGEYLEGAAQVMTRYGIITEFTLVSVKKE